MKQILNFTPFLALGFLAACQPSASDGAAPLAISEVETSPDIKEGAVSIRLLEPVSEPRACIVPIQIENGLDDGAAVTMIGFAVTGDGDDTTGNMFAPVAAAGDISEARVILEGQSCDAFDTISVPEVLCKSGEEDCAPKVDLIDGEALRFSQTG